MNLLRAILDRLGARPKTERLEQACGCVFENVSGTWSKHSELCRRVHKDRDGRVVNPPYLAAKYEKARGARRRPIH
jgi:hypothetical protein